MSTYIKVLLLPDFHYNSLNILMLTFLNIYFVSFSRSPNVGKMRVKIGQKMNYLFYFTRSCTQRFVVFYSFFSQKSILPRPKQIPERNLLLFKYFWIICFYSAFICFHAKLTFRDHRIIAIKSKWLIVRELWSKSKHGKKIPSLV